MARTIREMEPSQRPRERLLASGATVLSNAELIAVVIRTGRRGHGAVDEAHRLLREAGGLTRVARMDPRELVRRPGLGPSKAAALLAALELGSRLAGDQLQEGQRLGDPRAAGEFLVLHLAKERSEVFGFISIDSRHRLIRCNELTRGTRNQAPVDPAELFRIALLDDATGVLVFHNHPSGDLQPSRDDVGLTKRLVDGGRVLGVPVHDHLIVAGGRWLSLRRSNSGLFSDSRYDSR